MRGAEPERTPWWATALLIAMLWGLLLLGASWWGTQRDLHDTREQVCREVPEYPGCEVTP